MKTENNPHKTQYIASDALAVIFAQNLGQAVEYVRTGQSGMLTSIEITSFNAIIWINNETKITVGCRGLVLLKKPLEKISRVDLFEIKNHFNFHTSYDIDTVEKEIKLLFTGTENDGIPEWWPLPKVINLIDFLRERGYALPYKNWSVDQLVEFGIYKLIE